MKEMLMISKNPNPTALSQTKRSAEFPTSLQKILASKGSFIKNPICKLAKMQYSIKGMPQLHTKKGQV